METVGVFAEFMEEQMQRQGQGRQEKALQLWQNTSVNWRQAVLAGRVKKFALYEKKLYTKVSEIC